MSTCYMAIMQLIQTASLYSAYSWNEIITAAYDVPMYVPTGKPKQYQYGI